MNKKWLAGAGVAFALFVSPFNQVLAAEPAGQDVDVDNVAHRGVSGYAPENTIAAFDKSVEMKADYIEFDVQRSKDGEEEMSDLDAGSWNGKEFTGEKIPTFDEILDRYHGKIGILIELKAPELYPGIEESVAKKLKERNLDKPQNENNHLILNR